MRYTYSLTWIILVGAVCSGQVIDSFADGDFTNSPAWSGDTGSWQIVTDSDVAAGATNSYTLRLAHGTAASDTQYLSLQRTASWGTEQSWSFWIGRRNQTATSANQSWVWLWANESDLTSSTVDGYRIRFGDNTGGDNIVLQRVTDGSATNRITSTDTVTNGATDIGFLVRVTRTSASIWTLYTSTLPTTSGSGNVATDTPSKANTSVNQGTVTDGTYTNFSNGYFGFAAKHSTGADARDGVEFDQLYFDTSSDASLPVELTSWSARSEKGHVILDWTTESEIENLGFILYKSLLGNPLEWLTDYRFEPALRGQGSTTSRTQYRYVDKSVKMRKTYQYELSNVSYDGGEEKHGSRTVTVKAKGITWKRACPNPFNPVTEVTIFVGEESYLGLRIYDIAGQHMLTLVDQVHSPGDYTYSWNGTAEDGNPVASGIYFMVLQSGADRQTQKVVLLR